MSTIHWFHSRTVPLYDGLEQDTVEYISPRVPGAQIVEYFLHHGQSLK